MFEDVSEIYKNQGVGGGRVGFGKSVAMLVVDFQFMYTRGKRGCGTAAVEQTADVLAIARSAGVPVYYTYVAYPEDLSGVGVWIEKCPGLGQMIRGSDVVAIDELVTPQEGDVAIEKHFPSAFFGTGLAEQLRARGIDTVVTCGTSTSGCIRATVVDGVSHGFRMVIPRECVIDRSEPSEAAALFDMNAKYGDVVTKADVVAHLQSLGAAAEAHA